MTRRDWWLGIVALATVIALHAAVPRYEWRNWGGVPLVRVDRWTGHAVLGHYPNGSAGAWAPTERK